MYLLVDLKCMALPRKLRKTSGRKPQLYQIIHIDDKFEYKAYEATGELYDKLHSKSVMASLFLLGFTCRRNDVKG